MRRLQDAVIQGETISISDKGQDSFTALGPNLELYDCTIRLKISARAFALSGPKLYRCQINILKPLQTFRWCNAYLEDCRISGKLVGNDFGFWPEYFRPDGGLVGGDFTQAVLDGCRFINVDTSSITFPRWPCFTILRPAARQAAFHVIEWPGRLSTFARTYDDVPQEIGAITEFATELSRRYNVSEDEILQIVKGLDNVIY